MSGPPELPGWMFASCSITWSMFDDGEMSSAFAFDTMPFVSVNSGSSSGIPRGEHVDAGLDLAVEPVEERVAVALDVDDREVGALGHAEHPRRDFGSAEPATKTSRSPRR